MLHEPGTHAARWAAAAETVGMFASGCVEYVLAKEWYDYFHMYVLRLEPRPFCDSNHSCDYLPGSHLEFVLALVLFLSGALINVAARSKAFAWVPSANVIPGMTSMACGFALGDAVLTLRVEMYDAYGMACGMRSGGNAYSNCTLVDILVAVVATLVVAFTVTALLPLTRSIECGDTALVDTLEDYMQTVFRLISKALVTTAMVIWTKVLTRWATFGVDRPTEGLSAESLAAVARLQATSMSRTHLFWAAAITWLGSVIAVTCAHAQAALLPPGGAVKLEEAADKARVLWVKTVSELNRLGQSMLGWVAGCAWTDVVADLWPPTYWDPDADAHGMMVVLLNLGFAAVLTGLSAAYLVYTHEASLFEATSRTDVERSFLTGAMSFFVGWQWVIVLRDVTAVIYLARWDGHMQVLLGARPGVVVVGVAVSLFTVVFFVVKHRLVTGQWVGGIEKGALSA